MMHIAGGFILAAFVLVILHDLAMAQSGWFFVALAGAFLLMLV